MRSRLQRSGNLTSFQLHARFFFIFSVNGVSVIDSSYNDDDDDNDKVDGNVDIFYNNRLITRL